MAVTVWSTTLAQNMYSLDVVIPWTVAHLESLRSTERETQIAQ